MTTAPLIDPLPTPVDEAEFAALKAEIRAYVENEGERSASISSGMSSRVAVICGWRPRSHSVAGASRSPATSS
jgi:hypothetical protein